MDYKQIKDLYRGKERRLVDAIASGRIEPTERVMNRVCKYNIVHNTIQESGSVEKSVVIYKERMEIAKNTLENPELRKMFDELDGIELAYMSE